MEKRHILQTDLNMAKDIGIRNGENALPDYFIADIRSIIEQGRQQAYAADRQAAIATFWNVGRRIVEEERKGESRAAYGTRLIPMLADRLKVEYGDGYGKRNIAYYLFPKNLMFSDLEILHKRVQNLEWSHI